MENVKKAPSQGQEGRPPAKDGTNGHPQNGTEKVITPGDTQESSPQEMGPSGGQNGKYCRFYPNCRNVNCKFIHAYPPQPQFGGQNGGPPQMPQYQQYWMPPQQGGNPLMYQPLPYYMPPYPQQQGPGGDQRFPGGRGGPRRHNNYGGGFHRGPPGGRQPNGAGDEEEKHHLEGGPGPQIGGVCQYDQKCKKFPDCEFKHPKREYFATQPCGLYPNCNRKTCWFSHDPAKFQQGGSPGIGGGERHIPMGGGMMGGRGGYNQDNDDDKCKFDPGCRKYPDCQYKHPKREHLSTLPCKLYPNCTRQVCWFAHGPTPGVQQQN